MTTTKTCDNCGKHPATVSVLAKRETQVALCDFKNVQNEETWCVECVRDYEDDCEVVS